MKIGFIGTGTITTAVVTGLLRGGDVPFRVVVSPRSPDRAALLASSFQEVEVAPDNQGVIDQCDIVCIAVRPQIATDVLAELSFPESTTVISFIATYSVDEVRSMVAPASRVFRMGPIPSVERGLGPVILYPDDPELRTFFDPIGTLVAAESEAQLSAFWAVTAMMAPFFGLLDSTSEWLRRHGIAPAQADAYVGALFHSLSDTALSVHGEGFGEMAIEHATRGGLNEQLLRELRAANWLNLPADGLSLILDRLEGRADLEDGLESGSRKSAGTSAG
ncbi:pyrroline-5-carboxylate reductase [Elongatibacter sediminis]|uniref:Pyrroline-5-carboxylate reductase n=1 Tax=Elongatibacter sediminis TaxID=3119006 RepID=A0AAW9RDG7_9GAMM